MLRLVTSIRTVEKSTQVIKEDKYVVVVVETFVVGIMYKKNIVRMKEANKCESINEGKMGFSHDSVDLAFALSRRFVACVVTKGQSDGLSCVGNCPTDGETRMSGPQIQYRNHHRTQRPSGALLPVPLPPPVVALAAEAACKGGTSLRV